MHFSWYELRTIDLDGAERFYCEVMGWQVQHTAAGRVFMRGDEKMAGLAQLPEQARSRGAPPHWLGHIAVADVPSCAQRFIAAGGELRGPPPRELATLRDPQGAVLALSSRADGPSSAVAWHELQAVDGEAAWSLYGEILGWQSTGRHDTNPNFGTYRTFTWSGNPHSVGAFTSAAQNAHIHCHWLYYFAVDDLDQALARVTARAGRISYGPAPSPDGGRIAVCEDFHGAAFALRQRNS